mmetsp:Transcript_18966/g.40911  ORF Transcript_18966/g.40911 Transcript_18966/m.40911 type:complete len:215 (+) Transcript_18966:1195-1839(+)
MVVSVARRKHRCFCCLMRCIFQVLHQATDGSRVLGIIRGNQCKSHGLKVRRLPSWSPQSLQQCVHLPRHCRRIIRTSKRTYHQRLGHYTETAGVRAIVVQVAFDVVAATQCILQNPVIHCHPLQLRTHQHVRGVQSQPRACLRDHQHPPPEAAGWQLPLLQTIQLRCKPAANFFRFGNLRPTESVQRIVQSQHSETLRRDLLAALELVRIQIQE